MTGVKLQKIIPPQPGDGPPVSRNSRAPRGGVAPSGGDSVAVRRGSARLPAAAGGEPSGGDRSSPATPGAQAPSSVPRTLVMEVEPEAKGQELRGDPPAATPVPEEPEPDWVPGEKARLIDTPTTVKNLTKLAKAVKLSDNVLMVGPTGAGKTALVKYLAHLQRVGLRRINLNDMTDVTEIIGGYKPGPTGRPEWKDGIVTDALRKGHYILLDEINLAEPAILERLNSLLDDDRYLVLSEKLSQDGQPEVVRAHPRVRIFATMNPSSYAGRKNLSAAMLNRFHKVHIDGLPAEEMVEILRARSNLDEKTLLQMTVFHQKIAEMAEQRQIGKKGGPYPFTLRDLLKWVKRIQTYPADGLTQTQVIWKEAREVYQARFMNEDDRKVVEDFLELTFGRSNKPPETERDITIESRGDTVRIGEVTLHKNPRGGALVPGDDARLIHTPSTVRKLTRLAKSVELDEPVLMVGPTAAGKTAMVRYLAHLTNNNLRRFNLSLQTDTSEFIGGYVPRTDPQTGRPVPGEYVWKDGLLLEAMKKGDWVILDEINLADPAILERINSLLDDDRAIVVTEHNGERVQAHPNFRIFAAMNPATSAYAGRRDLSLAMRNRFTEQWVPELTDPEELTTIVSAWLKNVKGGEKAAAQMVKFHDEVRRKVEEGELASGRRDGHVYTLRDLKAWSRYLKVFSAEQGLREAFLDGAIYAYADGFSAAEDREAVEALARSYADKL